MCCRVSTLEPCQCCVLPCPARSRGKGVPTVQISASMPRLPRAETNVIQRSVSLTPPEHPRLPQDPSQAVRRHPRASHRVCGLLIRDMFLCCVRCPGLPEFSPDSRATHSYSPSPFAWHLPIHKKGSILYRNSEEENAPVPARGAHSMPGEVHNRCPASGLINLRLR